MCNLGHFDADSRTKTPIPRTGHWLEPLWIEKGRVLVSGHHFKVLRGPIQHGSLVSRSLIHARRSAMLLS